MNLWSTAFAVVGNILCEMQNTKYCYSWSALSAVLKEEPWSHKDFLNIKVTPAVWRETLEGLLTLGTCYGYGPGKRAMREIDLKAKKQWKRTGMWGAKDKIENERFKIELTVKNRTGAGDA